MATKIIPNVGKAARHPGHVVGYAKSEPIAGAVLIWIALLAVAAIVQTARTGKFTPPNRSGMVALGIATIVVVISAKFAPRIVTWILLAVFVVQAAQNQNALVQWIQQYTGRLTGTLAPTGR